jgi:glutamine---fructose-6-phosphate transaminase (isomerizing)
LLADLYDQPDAIRRASDGMAGSVDALGRLGHIGGAARTIVLTGMGGSTFACYPAVTELTARGCRAILVDAAELLHFRLGSLRPEDVVVAVSQSGRSAETLRLAEAVTGRTPRPSLVTVTNGLDNPLATLGDVRLDTRAGTEEGPSTKTFASSLVVLRAVTAAIPGGSPERAALETGRAAELAARDVEGLLDRAGDLGPRLAAWHGGRPWTVVLGRGPARAAAEMGALFLKEAAGIPAEGLETGQFRHGPLELAGPDLAAIVVATEPETEDIDHALAAELTGTGSSVLTVGCRAAPEAGGLDVVVSTPDRMLRPAVAVVPMQLLGRELALARGRVPGTMVRATKVTTRE